MKAMTGQSGSEVILEDRRQSSTEVPLQKENVDCLWAGASIHLNRHPKASCLLIGFLKANRPGVAKSFYKALSNALQSTSHEDAEESLSNAYSQCQSSMENLESFVACVVLIKEDTLAYLTTGQGLIALKVKEDIRVLASPSEEANSPSVPEDIEGSLDSHTHTREAAFGSLIAIERDSLSKNRLDIHISSFPLQSQEFLMLFGSSPTGAQCMEGSISELFQTHKSQFERIHRESQKSKFTLIGDGTQIQDGCCFLALDELVPKSPQNSFEVRTPERRVSFVQVDDHSPFAWPEGWIIGNSGHGANNLHPQGAHRDQYEMLSSLRHLDGPGMTIPEDKLLPQGSLAGQLPPPLLAPIRKAYPSGEWTITPEMLSSPSPARKVRLLSASPYICEKGMIGRAASFNSPNGLWMPENSHSLKSLQTLGDSSSQNSVSMNSNQNSLPLYPSQNCMPLHSNQSSGHLHQSPSKTFGSGMRHGREDERYRGGLPRPSSSSHLSHQSYASASPTETPTGSPPSAKGLSASLNSRGSNLQDSDSQEEIWNAPISPAGRKMRGRSTALRMLKSSDETRLSNKRSNDVQTPRDHPYSAPANLLAEGASESPNPNNTLRNEPRKSADSSQTDESSLGQELLSRTTSATSSGGSRTVLCLPPLTENPEGKTVNQRARRVSFPNSESSSLENPFQSSQALSQSLGQEKGRRQSLRQRAHIQSPDTAEIARGRHQIKLEGRQHSGMAFSKSSPDVRLGDSVQSLTMTEG